MTRDAGVENTQKARRSKAKGKPEGYFRKNTLDGENRSA